jgi:signal transduction histidine kinase
VNIHADPARVGQVLRNLLGNALRHTPAGTSVSVRATLLGDRVKFSVSDEGPGISPEDQIRIFAKFGRSHDTNRNNTPGLGLGLYLSRRILQAHGSDLSVESRVGEGTTFWFTLELAP